VAQRQLYQKKRDMVDRTFHGIRKLYGGEGAFYWMLELSQQDLNGASDEEWVMDTMNRNLVITLPGSAFGSQCNGLIRLSYGAKEQDLSAALEILLQRLKR
jgi:aspartate/methionine/tyrosine aminotransferase